MFDILDRYTLYKDLLFRMNKTLLSIFETKKSVDIQLLLGSNTYGYSTTTVGEIMDILLFKYI